MTGKSSRRTQLIVLLLVVLAGLGAVFGPGLVARRRAREFTPVMEAFVAAAVAGDSVALERLTVRPGPVRWAMAMRQSDPGLFPLAARGLRPSVLGPDTGLVRVFFRFRRNFEVTGCRFPYEGIFSAFRRAPAGWRLVQAGLGPC